MSELKYFKCFIDRNKNMNLKVYYNAVKQLHMFEQLR